jgi:hypothetical protein
MSSKSIKVGFWNMLAVGLSDDGFVTEDPESIDWAVRGPKIVAVLNRMFDEGYDVISVVENDMFLYILEGLQAEGRPIYGEIQRIRNKKNVNNSYTQWFKQTKTNTRSFQHFIKNESDCEEFVQLMNSDKTSDGAPDVSVSDPYLADHGNSVYWNPAKVYAVGPVFPEFNQVNCLLTRSFKCYIGRGDNGFVQKFVKEQSDGFLIEFNVLTAHLKSGESAKEEQERVDTLTPLLRAMATLTNPVVLMDSNSSVHYRKAIDLETNVATVIEDAGFVDAIDTPGNRAQCVKLRGDTVQKQKAGEIMCDTIDVLLTKRGTNVQVIPVGGVQLYNPAHKTIMTKLRADPEPRQRVSSWVLNANNRYDANGTYIGSDDGELRPTGFPLVPIQNKEKTITLKMMSSNKKSRWGPDAKTNVYKGFAKYLFPNESDVGFLWRLYNRLWGGEPEFTDETLESAFRGLYPNKNMPSDHPPLGAIIELV